MKAAGSFGNRRLFAFTGQNEAGRE